MTSSIMMSRQQVVLRRPADVVSRRPAAPARLTTPQLHRNVARTYGTACRAEASEGNQAGAAQANDDAGNPKGEEQIMQSYYSSRVAQVQKYFPSSLGMDDFVARIEMALYAFGFHGDNTIICSNLCRDEVTVTLKQKLDAVFGSAFNINGLGAFLTCGVTGMGAGLSHAPFAEGEGRERYIFFSFPHIGIDSTGELGAISRPGRPGPSSACGALKAALGDIKSSGLAASWSWPGVHEPNDPEYSILKQRLARRLSHERLSEADVQKLDLADITKAAERTITADLEDLIERSVDPKKADYAVVTGVQIHNWGEQYDDASPNMEFVAPASTYVVIRGQRTNLDITSLPAMTPRQIAMLSAGSAPKLAVAPEADVDMVGSAGGVTTVRDEAPDAYGSRQRRAAIKKQAENLEQLLGDGQVEVSKANNWPGWQSNMQWQATREANDDKAGASSPQGNEQ